MNLGPDSTNGHLVTGMTNAVAGKLMKTEGLRVLAPGRPRLVKRMGDIAGSGMLEIADAIVASVSPMAITPRAAGPA